MLATLGVLGVCACGSPAKEAPPAPEASVERPWHEGAVFYEVYVRSFQDSDGDGVGDLPGLVSRLDYLNDGKPGEGDDLEVDGIWLMPVFASPSPHGYDTTDYRAVDPVYGTNEDLEILFREAKARGMRVILDLVVNHTSWEHPWFQDAVTGPDAEHRDFYVWRDDDPGWVQPWGGSTRTWHLNADAYYYGLFWQGMPDLNFRNPRVAEAMNDIGRHWIERGAAGYRLDAARYLVEDEIGRQADLPETHSYFKGLRATLDEVDDEHILVGEVWTDRDAVATYRGDGDELHLAFDFDLAGAIVRGLNSGSSAPIADELGRVQDWSFQATFLNNHDMERLSRRLQKPGSERAAATLLLTLPGTPFIYYGDEYAMAHGVARGDEAQRTPMAWDDAEGAGFSTGTPWVPLAPGAEMHNVAAGRSDAESLWAHHQELIRSRRANPALRSRHIEVLETSSEVLAFLRRGEGQVMLVAVNVSGRDLEGQVLDLTEFGHPKIELPALAAGGDARIELTP